MPVYQVLSVLIPAYNEEKTIAELLQRVWDAPLPEGLKKEIVVVDDCSTDQTASCIQTFMEKCPGANVRCIRHIENGGKGRALRTAIASAKGDIMIVQDADLECDPNDYAVLLPPILSGREVVIYGSRFLNPEQVCKFRMFYWGGCLVTAVANLLYNQRLTDEPTCYKMFDAELLRSIPLTCEGFEFCPEITAKLAKRGFRIKEVPIHYYPRTKQEGKKIKWHDGLLAIWTLIRYRFKSE